MEIDRSRVRALLGAGDLRALFIEELGYDRHRADLTVHLGASTYLLHGIAQKRGFVVFECTPGAGDPLPDYATRAKIEREIRKTNFEHLTIYHARNGGEQRWQWVRTEPGRPTRSREQRFVPGRSNELLLRTLGLLAVSLDEEAALTLPDVTAKYRKAFDVEKVTRRFYEQFRKEHAAFLSFVTGITETADREWYASVMLNRLMFVYFIQKQGFLDGDRDYLRNRLRSVRALRGKDTFHTFYRYFLLRLFHDGLGKPKRDPELTKLIGVVPYLNGGMFLPHLIEETYPAIEIADAAFERVFDLFDQYQWHLDERPNFEGNEINPDVIGYIFEKYINQKELGAYYTKEDITAYIAIHTVVPYLLSRANGAAPVLTAENGGVWQILEDAPDRYIEADLQHGVELDLPPQIARGLADSSHRTAWDAEARDENLALPTETWRECVNRRARYTEIRRRLDAHDIRSVADLVESNLDLERLVQDTIASAESADVVLAFWSAVRGLSVLDPACGSGAFLFAALNVLERIYEACLDRMQALLAADATLGATQKDVFASTLAEAARHPNRRYFVLKMIAVNNLYGVDLVEEATEICKLRLFLKLVAQVEHCRELEPLPDIDFNIRAGNTLVGFSNLGQIQAVMGRDLVRQMALPSILERAERADEGFRRYRAMQTDLSTDAGAIAAAKKVMRQKFAELHEELDGVLAEQHGVRGDGAVAQWRRTHQPFHWLVEFYSILLAGGFDVIIGNPPYIELNALEGYRPDAFTTASAGNLYALVMERSLQLAGPDAWLGFIVPVSSISTERYAALQTLLKKGDLFYSAYDDRPSRLFEGLEHIRLTIHLIHRTAKVGRLRSTNYQKWHAPARDQLFSTIAYAPAAPALIPDTLPKLCSPLESGIIKKLTSEGNRLSAFYARRGRGKVFYSRKVGYFLQVLDFEPRVLDGAGRRRPPSEFKELTFGTPDQAALALACLNSNLFYWFVTVFSDCRHLNKREVDAFPVNLTRLGASDVASPLREAATALMENLKATSEHRVMRFRHDTLTVQCIMPRQSKPSIDKIDRLLARHYGFTDEELDFILSYDLKFRMGLYGQASEEEDE